MEQRLVGDLPIISAAVWRPQVMLTLLAVYFSLFGMIIICPPLTGWIADQFSLQAALITVGLSGLAVIWLARRIRIENWALVGRIQIPLCMIFAPRGENHTQKT